MTRETRLTGVERFFDYDDIIVSKTDLKGKIVYCNDIFLSISGYTESECLGQPHSMIRHPDMPRCVFHLLWQSIQSGEEIFAYVVNRCKNGDHYWVCAHVTPSFDESGKIISYHSNRRVADPEIVRTVFTPLYQELKVAEDSCSNRKDGLIRSTKMLNDHLAKLGLGYNEWILTPQNNKEKAA
ncbi:MAG: PAS domain-containing protein [Robiginitomaculum sp.]|nr:PAS domain-containing protein [Robiginitomaculum sp.]